MTLPDERYRSVLWAKRFLQDLAHNTKDYPRVPKKVRGEAYSILRHFPNDWDMEQVADASPHIIQQRMEPVTRLFKQYEQGKKNEA
jgi:hypothetical protein